MISPASCRRRRSSTSERSRGSPGGSFPAAGSYASPSRMNIRDHVPQADTDLQVPVHQFVERQLGSVELDFLLEPASDQRPIEALLAAEVIGDQLLVDAGYGPRSRSLVPGETLGRELYKGRVERTRCGCAPHRAGAARAAATVAVPRRSSWPCPHRPAPTAPNPPIG